MSIKGKLGPSLSAILCGGCTSRDTSLTAPMVQTHDFGDN